MFKKYVKSFLLLIIFFMCVACVCASDVNDDVAAHTDDAIDEFADVPGTFDELNDDMNNLHCNDVYNFTRDYHFEQDPSPSTSSIIEISADNVTINGNGHVIDGGALSNHSSSVFKVTGDNVKIFNLNFVNSYSNPVLNSYNAIRQTDKADIYIDHGDSPITWLGNNGILSDCLFSGNSAVKGGAITWNGDNGLSIDCVFINNTARGIGGALFIGGENNRVETSCFINCISNLSGEAIYINRNRKNITFENNTFENQKVLIIDGVLTNIDVDKYFDYHYMSAIGDELVDLVPILYSFFTNGGTNYYNENISYYGEYLNGYIDFIFTIVKNFDDGVSYTKHYSFESICDCNSIFDKMIDSEDYENTYLVTKNIEINPKSNIHDQYIAAINTKINTFKSFLNSIKAKSYGATDAKLIESKLLDSNNENIPVTFVLNITFNGAFNIYCTDAFEIDKSGFNVVSMNGNGTKIYSEGDCSKERKWAVIEKDQLFIASDLIIEKFNTAVENTEGICAFTNMKFQMNMKDYWFTKDHGAAILNTGIVVCTNCAFTDNYAKNGGAIFNQGMLSLDNCVFSGNEAYGEGKDVCVDGKGGVILDGIFITKDYGPIHFKT